MKYKIIYNGYILENYTLTITEEIDPRNTLFKIMDLNEKSLLLNSIYDGRDYDVIIPANVIVKFSRYYNMIKYVIYRGSYV